MSAIKEARLTLVTSWSEAEEFWQWYQQPHEWLAVDTETGGLDWWRDPLRLVQIGDTDAGWAIPWYKWGGIAKQAIEEYTGPMVMHNSKFDLHFLEHNGVKVPRHLLHDSMPMVGLAEPTLPKGLKPASERHVAKGSRAGDRMLQSVMDKNGWDWATIPIDVQEYWAYAAMDVVMTARLARLFYKKMQDVPYFQAYVYEVAVAQVLCDMETHGLKVDETYIHEMIDKLTIEEEQLRDFFRDEMDVINPLADKQLITWFEKAGYEFTEFTDKGNKKLDKVVLEQITEDRPELDQIVKAIHKVRNYHKMKGTYFEAFLDLQDADGRLHTSINPMGAITGRMSSSRPNLQNVPSRAQGKMVRRAFVASEGHKIVSADFDQIEYRIMVSRAQETRLIEAINEGRDLHTYMTSVVYNKPEDQVAPNERTIMKNATFAFLYGAGDAKFARMAGISVTAAHEFRTLYAKEFPNIAKYAHDVEHIARGQGEISTKYLGRTQKLGGDEAYKLLNYVTQGEAGDVLKKKLVELSQTPAGEHMSLPIHDEILFEVPEEEVDQTVEIIKEVMPEKDYYEVPLTVGAEVLDTWGDKY